MGEGGREERIKSTGEEERKQDEQKVEEGRETLATADPPAAPVFHPRFFGPPLRILPKQTRSTGDEELTQ